MDKKTNFPDLEILPPHNHLKHFFDWLISKPRMIIEDYVRKNFTNEIMYVVGDEWHAGNLSYHLNTRPKWFKSIKDKIDNLDPKGGIVYTGNPDILKEVCPGDFGKIDKQGFCMIGSKN